jgi:hypothetical protein
MPARRRFTGKASHSTVQRRSPGYASSIFTFHLRIPSARLEPFMSFIIPSPRNVSWVLSDLSLRLMSPRQLCYLFGLFRFDSPGPDPTPASIPRFLNLATPGAVAYSVYNQDQVVVTTVVMPRAEQNLDLHPLKWRFAPSVVFVAQLVCPAVEILDAEHFLVLAVSFRFSIQ